jgi:integrase
MPRPATGQVIRDDRGASPVYRLRFTVDGRRERMTLGSEADGWTEAKACEALKDELARARLGLRQSVEPKPCPDLHTFASEWFAARETEGLRPATLAHLRWALVEHILPHFATMALDQITVAEVDRYVQAKARSGLSPSSINRTVSILGSILEQAVDYDLIPRNPAKGRRRRLRAPRPHRPYLDSAEQVAALLDGAKALDDAARVNVGQRRALLATLVFAGLRIGEALALRWHDVDLARGVLHVRGSKTDAGVRAVPMLEALRDEMAAYAVRARQDDDAYVFATTTGAKQTATNVRKRVLAKAIEAANERHAEAAIPEALTLHSLRRTAASIWFAVGETPPAVMAAMGHTTPAMTLAAYAREMQRRDGEPERLKALVEGRDVEEFRPPFRPQAAPENVERAATA